MHGATGVSQWTPLAGMYQSQRTLRLADGPDEVHWMVVGRSGTCQLRRPRSTRLPHLRGRWLRGLIEVWNLVEAG